MSQEFNIIDKHLSYSSVDDKDVYLLIRKIKKGIEYSIFSSITKESPFTLNEWSNFLHISERTMQRNKKEKRAFDPIHAEKILQVTLLYKFGVDVFGDKNKFNNWLETGNLGLGQIKPKELLDNSFGISLLKDELTRIEHGVLA